MHRSSIAILLGCCTGLCASLPAAAQESNTLELVGAEFNERFEQPTLFNRVPVAGLYVHAETPTDGPVVQIVVDKASDIRTFCVKAITADGFYEAVNTYTLPDSFAGGVGVIRFASQRPGALADLDPGTFGLAVFEGPCGERGAAAGNLVPAYWNADPDNDAAQASVAVNSMRADRVFLYVGDAPIVCQPIAATVRHNFDTLCTFDLALLPAGKTTALRIVSVADQRPRPEEVVIVHRQSGRKAD
jgi:hypothetical protein